MSTAPKEKPPADGKMSKSKKKRLKKKLKRQQELLDIQLKQMSETAKPDAPGVSPLTRLSSFQVKSTCFLLTEALKFF